MAIVHQTIRYSVEIYCVRSTDDGQTWDSGQYVSEYDSISGVWPSMDVDDSGGIHVTWFDYKYTPYAWTGDIFHRVSRDSGEIWEEIDSLTVMHRARASDILAEGNSLHLVWEDDRHSFGDNFEIYYRMSRDLGHTWESEVRLTNALNNSNTPSLACGGGYLHLFWRDGREYEKSDSGSSIYYKRKDLSHSITELHKSSPATDLRIDVYPNPFSQILNIRSMQPEDKLEIKIFDACGKEVMDYEVKNKSEKLRLDTQDMSSGVYFVQIKANGEKVMKKVVKLH